MTMPEIDQNTDSDEMDGADANSVRRWKASVSLEFDVSPVLTWKGEVDGARPHTAFSRAIRAATKAYPHQNPRSWVCVLEKL